MNMQTNLNQLEPQSLVDAFIKHPPETFKVQNSQDFLPFFYTNFNLLTTLDVPLRKKIESAWGYQYWGGCCIYRLVLWVQQLRNIHHYQTDLRFKI